MDTTRQSQTENTKSVTTLEGDRLEAALAVASLPTMLLVVFQLTGDERWLEDPFRPGRAAGLEDNSSGGFPQEIQDEIRRAAYDAIVAWQAGKQPVAANPGTDLLVRMLSTSMGEEVGLEYGPMIAQELGLDVARDIVEPQARRDFRVIVIGTGISGLAAAKALGEAGIDYAVLERMTDVGGTWRDNVYPGCGVDTPSALYSYSFSDYGWSRYFAGRDEVQHYLKTLAEDADIVPNVRFDRDVVSARFDESSNQWEVRTRSSAGEEETFYGNAVISAVGVFTQPKFPDVPGLRDFTGRVVHTARWDADLDLTGRKVGVVGNGASAMQLIPAIVDTASQVTVFQRSPHWIAPFPQFHEEVPGPLVELSAAVPLYRQWYRVRCGWTFNDRLHSALQKDPTWDHPERAVSAQNDSHRRAFTRYLKSQLEGREDLQVALLPDYPPFGKRILLDNGWFAALKRDDVQLVTDRIATVEGGDVVTSTGSRFDLDVLVCATGFDAVSFLSPMDVIGKGGRHLREVWGPDDAQAYLGTAVPGFPNFFMLYGPNVQAGHGGSLVGLAEMQVHYVLDLLGQMLAAGRSSVEVREEVWADYTREVDHAHERMVWTHPGMETYYRNSRGRVVIPSPFRIVDLWHRTRHADLREFICAGLRHAGGNSNATSSDETRIGTHA